MYTNIFVQACVIALDAQDMLYLTIGINNRDTQYYDDGEDNIMPEMKTTVTTIIHPIYLYMNISKTILIQTNDKSCTIRIHPNYKILYMLFDGSELYSM